MKSIKYLSNTYIIYKVTKNKCITYRDFASIEVTCAVEIKLIEFPLISFQFLLLLSFVGILLGNVKDIK